MPPVNNSLPYEIIGAPYAAWFAPVGTAFPAIDAEPSLPWVSVGTSGPLNINADGVKVSHSQTITKFRSVGDTGTRKTFRTEEDQMVALALADLTLEQYQHALNGNPITTVAAGAGTAGYKKIGLSRGSTVKTIALLVRGPSPYVESGYAQYEIPRAQQDGSQEPTFKNGDAALLALEWTTLVDPDATSDDERFGRLVAMTAPAL